MSVASLRRWRLLKIGPKFLRVGGRAIKYRPEDLQAWLESRPVGGTHLEDPSRLSQREPKRHVGGDRRRAENA